MTITAITVNDFSKAVEQLGDKATLRLKEDGSGIATSLWDRFKVGLCDLFRSSGSIAAKQQETVHAFLTAVRREQGNDMGDIATRKLGMSTSRLTGRLVTQTTDHLSKHGGGNWVSNEKMISMAAHSTRSSPPYNLCLTSIVNPVCEELVNKAQDLGLPKDKAIELLHKYTLDQSPSQPKVDLPNISGAIEGALRKAATFRGEDGITSFRKLEPQQVVQIAKDTANKVILEEINRSFRKSFDNDHPFKDAFINEATQRGLKAHLPVLSDEDNLPKFYELETFAVLDARELLPPEKMQALRNQIFDNIFTRQKEKLDQIDALKLPEGPAKTEMVKICMSNRSRMDANYFAQVKIASETIDAFAKDISSKLTLDEQYTVALKLGEALGQSSTATGAEGDAAGDFLTLAFDVFMARSKPETLDKPKKWLDDQQAGGAVYDRIMDQWEDKTLAHAIPRLNITFGLFKDIDNYKV